MREIPITFKNIIVFMMLILMTYGFTWLYNDFSKTIEDNPAEEKVEVKYSKKGLYLYPRFEVHVTNSERPSAVTRKQFESIQPGDTISGYMKNEDTFVTDKDVQFEKSLGIPILIVLYLGTFVFCGGLLRGTKIFKNNATLKNLLHKIIKFGLFGILTLYIIAGLIFIGLTATNVFHKMNKWNQTEVEATVLGYDFNTTRSHRGGSYTTYEMFLQYMDKKGALHFTKKAVTGTTYKKYDYKETIPLLYRNNNVYDTFIYTKDTKEIWPAFLNLYTLFLSFYIVSVFAMIKAWRKKKRKQKEAHLME